ncbi:bifunctional lysylphosphatidylglycerol flippase/synthetase MprF [Streptomyces sp. NPDC127033]|uniref:bifunctional lysylphosphatidylglycerol flippase/synthetase MprF n=1 Tax=Streptomyces sp. NPDC127033 TaxID=3347110 RepID=UPI003653C2B8
MTTLSGVTTDEEVLDVLERLRAGGDNPSAFLALNSGNGYFTDPATDGVVAYREAGSYLLQFGGVHAPPDQRETLLRAFLDHARRRRRKVVAVQVLAPDVDLFVRCGFTVNQIGSSYSVHLPDFALRGSRFMKLRNKISRARRSGLEVTEVPYGECAAEVDGIDGAWLRSKGRHVKEIEFLVGELGGPAQHARRLMLGRLDGKPVAYISYSPAYGSRPGWLHDLSRRLPDAPPGVMEAINLTALERFREEEAEWLHFGFTPFTGLSAEHDPAGAGKATRKIIRLLADRGDTIYPAASQLAYKEKWGPQLVLPEYVAFHGRARLGAIWQILRVTKSV